MASSPTRADKASVNQSFHALMRLLRYAKGYRRQIITATICSIINKLFDIAPEILIGVAIDVVVNQENSFVARLGFESPQEQITILAVLTFFIWAGESLFECLFGFGAIWPSGCKRICAKIPMSTPSASTWRFLNRKLRQLVALNDDVNQLGAFWMAVPTR